MTKTQLLTASYCLTLVQQVLGATGITTLRGIYVCSKNNWSDCHWYEVDIGAENLPQQCLKIEKLGGIVAFGPDKGMFVDSFADDKCTQPLLRTTKCPG